MRRGDGEPACESLADHLADLAEGHGTPAQRQHLATCATCQARLQDTLQLRAALSRLPPVPLPATFEADLAAQLQHVAPAAVRRRPALIWGTAVALAASIAFVVMQHPAADVQLQVTQLVSIDVTMNAALAMDDVHMHMALPAGLELASDDGALAALPAVDYVTQLQPGTNRLNVVLRANRAGTHRVRVEVSAGDQHAAMDLVVQVAPNQQAHARLEFLDGTAGLHFGGLS